MGTNSVLDPEIAERSFEQIIGSSTALEAVLKQVELVATTGSTVLIEGETGTGKELVARAIHNISSRCGKPFVKLNCAAIPFDLLESELFGHEKGAFTGAIAQKIGRFEAANGGTLFLDEVGDVPSGLQPKLLRVLQEQEFERLGSTRTCKVDVRLVAATNKALGTMVEEGEFRADLYYRLNVFPLHLPPLRERREDIVPLVHHFLKKFAHKMGKPVQSVSQETLDAFTAYHWPGNIRELQNLVERAVILSSDGILVNPVPVAASIPGSHELLDRRPTVQDFERNLILEALQAANWVIGGNKGAATRLGLKRTTLISKMQKHGITRQNDADNAPSYEYRRRNA